MSISQISQQSPIWSRAATALANASSPSNPPAPPGDRDGGGAAASISAASATTAATLTSPFQQLSQGMQAALLQLQPSLGGSQADGSQLASTGTSAVDGSPGGAGASPKSHGHHRPQDQDNGAGSGVSIAGTGPEITGTASSLAA